MQNHPMPRCESVPKSLSGTYLSHLKVSLRLAPWLIQGCAGSSRRAKTRIEIKAQKVVKLGTPFWVQFLIEIQSETPPRVKLGDTTSEVPSIEPLTALVVGLASSNPSLTESSGTVLPDVPLMGPEHEEIWRLPY